MPFTSHLLPPRIPTPYRSAVDVKTSRPELHLKRSRITPQVEVYYAECVSNPSRSLPASSMQTNQSPALGVANRGATKMRLTNPLTNYLYSVTKAPAWSTVEVEISISGIGLSRTYASDVKVISSRPRATRSLGGSIDIPVNRSGILRVTASPTPTAHVSCPEAQYVGPLCWVPL
ncbi:hypothetical protein K431DRAFT_298519 [Polychaeton citri CBS 116435]|uniref:Uncharacterized protein n=1 Tax=Polychaeton citri CBS 116435 TaxID=1314669 RepID=A0A9P4UKB8_9PEZI|nr:hypothetical protein K431DRAFT_298519 [Polychaeton citri CBS 116435]